MITGCLVGKADNILKIKRFCIIINTSVGEERRLVDAGIRLLAIIDAGLVPEGPEELKVDVLDRLCKRDCKDKIFGTESTIELRKEPGFERYFHCFVRIVLACFAPVVATWLVIRILFVW